MTITVDQLLEKIKELRDPSERGTDLEQLCWFISYQEARDFLEVSSTKDVAHIIQNGEPIAGPFRTWEDVAEWIVFEVETLFDGDEEEFLKWAEGRMRAFFAH